MISNSPQCSQQLTKHKVFVFELFIAKTPPLSKTFLTSMLPPSITGSGVCLASRPWLDFCGFGECDVAWRQPRDLLQGPLTTQAHKDQMHAYFKRCGLAQVGRRKGYYKRPREDARLFSLERVAERQDELVRLADGLPPGGARELAALVWSRA